MNEPQPSATDERQAQKAVDTQYYRALLHALLDGGAIMHTLVTTQAKDEREEAKSARPPATPQIPLSELAAAYDRIARAMRRCIALALRLDTLAADAHAKAPSAARAAPTPEQAAQAAAARIAARKRILREVEDAIERNDPSLSDLLHSELHERMDSEDLEEDIANRPVSEIIADICRDLGVGVQSSRQKWKRRTPEDIEALCNRATAQGASPKATSLATAALISAVERAMKAEHPNSPQTQAPDPYADEPPDPGPKTLPH